VEAVAREDADGLVAAADAVPVDATWKPAIVELAGRVAPVLPASAPVVTIYINRTGTPNARFPVASWAVPGLTRTHTGAWPLALDLFEEGRLSGPATAAVKARLIELGGIPLVTTPEEFGKIIADETEKWAKVVKFSGASVDY